MRTRAGAVVNMTTMAVIHSSVKLLIELVAYDSIVVLIIAAKLVINILVFSCSIVHNYSVSFTLKLKQQLHTSTYALSYGCYVIQNP